MCRVKLIRSSAMSSSVHSLHVMDWSFEVVGEWLESKGYGKYVNLFKNHSIDGKALLLINESDLRSPPLEIHVSKCIL